MKTSTDAHIRLRRRLVILLIAGCAAVPSATPAGAQAPSLPSGGDPPRPAELAGVTAAGDVVLIDARDGSTVKRIFKHRPDPGGFGTYAYGVQRAVDGTVYFELGPEPAVGEIHRYDPDTGRSTRFGYGANISLSRDGRYLAATIDAGVIVLDTRTGEEVAAHRLDRPNLWPTHLAWSSESSLYVSYQHLERREVIRTGTLDLVSGEWSYAGGVWSHLHGIFSPSYRSQDTMIALRNRRDRVGLGTIPSGLRIMEVDLPGRVDRTLVEGEFVDVATRDGGKWIVASRPVRALMIIAPSGTISTLRHPDLKRIIDVDW